ncbi:hypothetical protein EV659_101200 [Rhodothalassium salexigens DSM 2132]|uniref:Uncharacterized protein n=2 Tax=Rhodothalassium salexigens TaxID=1086 RepID=A0A4R2PVX4_RHOSA|nr:hypothetical protein EV659_101200 [Rhodothalassium salexigens DSM 2132]
MTGPMDRGTRRRAWRLGALALVLVLAAGVGAGLVLRPTTDLRLGAAVTDCHPLDLVDATTGRAITGIEDLAPDPVAGWLYLSAFDRRAVAHELAQTGRAQTQGALYRLRAADLERAGPLTLEPLAGAAPVRPHGIALSADRRRLFVVDRANAPAAAGAAIAPRLRAFDIAADRLVPAWTLDHPGLCRANDVVALGPDRVAVTLDHGACDGWRRGLEDVFKLPRARLAIAGPEGLVRTPERFVFANGVVRMPDGRLAVAETRARRLRLVSPDRSGQEPGAAAPGTETPDTETAGAKLPGAETHVPLPFPPDNLTPAPGGGLIAAGPPRLMRYALFCAGWAGVDTTPSAVAHVSGQGRVTPLVAGALPGLSGATVAAQLNRHLVIASGYDRGLNVCRLTTGRP